MDRRGMIKMLAGSGMMLSGASAFSALREMRDGNSSEHPMPAFFIGHGNPMNGIEDNAFSRSWADIGKSIPKPKAILCVSAHWYIRKTAITAMPKPRTIHDFGGFPQRLFDVEYDAPGSPELASEIAKDLAPKSVTLDHEWGLDHGCWTVIKQMFPKADIPVLQLSIDHTQPASYHYELGQLLAKLRTKGILVIGSGNMVHNLRKISMPPGVPLSMESAMVEYGLDWAQEADAKFKELICNKQHEELVNYHKLGKAVKLAVPTPDHYYPLLYILGLQGEKDSVRLFNDKFVAGSLSMTSLHLETT